MGERSYGEPFLGRPSSQTGADRCVQMSPDLRPKKTTLTLLVTLLLALPVGLATTPATADEPDGIVPNEWNGYIACGVGTLAFRAAACSIANDASEDFLRIAPLDAGLETLVIAFDWEPTTDLTGQELLLTIDDQGAALNGPYYARLEGPPPLEVRLDDLPADIDEVRFRVFAGGDSVDVVLDQPFVVHHDAFYGTPAPDGYSALPE